MLVEKKTIKNSSSPYYKGYNIIADNNNIQCSITTNNPSLTKKNNNKYTSHQKHFLLCKSCFWCATYLINNDGTTIKYIACNNAKVESLPMSNNEPYLFGYSLIICYTASYVMS